MSFTERSDYWNKKRDKNLAELKKNHDPQFRPQTNSKGESRIALEMQMRNNIMSKIKNISTLNDKEGTPT